MPTQAHNSGGRPLKVGIFLPYIERPLEGKTARWSDLKAKAQRAEDVGFDSVWIADHLVFQFGPIKAGPWECWSILSALAAVTRRVELGTLVVCTSFRNPALLAKMAETVDEISNGRLILGLGAGYHEPEFRAFGYPYDHRVSRFEEAVQIISTLLRKGKIDFEGRYYQARECELRPRGPRPAGVPVMIGTQSPRMLRLTAQHADLWNGWLIFGRSQPDAIPALRDAVDAACRDVGRKPATLGRTVAVSAEVGGQGPSMVARLEQVARRAVGIKAVPLSGSPEVLAEALRAFAREGVSHIQVQVQPSTVGAIEAFAPVLELLDRG